MVAFGLALSVALVVSFSFYFETERLVLRQKVEELRTESELVETLLTELYNQTSSDVLFLSRTPSIQGLASAYRPVNSPENRLWINQVEKAFTEMISSNPLYSQIRYIGVADNGRELVSVVKNPGGIQSIPALRLQQKDESSDFKASNNINTGGVYFSPIELNHERNNGIAPLQRVLRVSTPIFNPATDERFGTVVINIDFGYFFRRLKDLELVGIKWHLTNKSGRFLYNHNLNLDSAIGSTAKKIIFCKKNFHSWQRL